MFRIKTQPRVSGELVGSAGNLKTANVIVLSDNLPLLLWCALLHRHDVIMRHHCHALEISMHRNDEKLRGVSHWQESLGETHEWMFFELKSILGNGASIRTHVWVSKAKTEDVTECSVGQRGNSLNIEEKSHKGRVNYTVEPSWTLNISKDDTITRHWGNVSILYWAALWLD